MTLLRSLLKCTRNITLIFFSQEKYLRSKMTSKISIYSWFNHVALKEKQPRLKCFICDFSFLWELHSVFVMYKWRQTTTRKRQKKRVHGDKAKNTSVTFQWQQSIPSWFVVLLNLMWFTLSKKHCISTLWLISRLFVATPT